MGDVAATAEREDLRRFLTFRVAERLYALPADEVSEVIRTPAVARLPQGPASLLGLANLRGAVLPVASVRGLLRLPERAPSPDDRSIVLDGAAPVALAVDAIDGLVSVAASRVETRQAELTAEDGEQLSGTFQPDGRTDVAKVLDVRRLLAAAFLPRARPERRATVQSGEAMDAAGQELAQQKLVTFEVADQEYGLALEVVREILPAPEATAAVPRSESVVVGVMAYRDALLPLLSLRGLLGFPGAAAGERDKVVVTTVAGALLGLVADRVRSIISADPALVDATPPMLAARTGGEARVTSIYRGQGGRRLVSILAPEQLFREDVMQRLGEAGPGTSPSRPEAAASEQMQFLVFRLGDDEFGLPIETVDEVARVPEQITRVPKTPKFLEGVINLRGEVLPVVDQRRRFDMPPLANREARRLIVLQTERLRAGVIVDSVSEVLRCAADAIAEAPDLTGEATRLVRGVVNLPAAGRIVLLLDPEELLTRAERGLLEAFKPHAGQAGL
ncbi:MAG: chemotaxis protein CheW [Phenylobacterium sp.]